MIKHVPAEVSYKAARALAYLITRKWWKELKDAYNTQDTIRQESGLEIEDYILANANEETLSQVILWPSGKTGVWSKRNVEFKKLWNNNFNSLEGTAEEKVDEPLFKVGDKVRIKERTKDDRDYWGCFTDPMAELTGTVCTVQDVREMRRSSNLGCLPDDGYFYDLDDNSGESCYYFWASSMLEKA